MAEFITAAMGTAHVTPLQDSMIHRGLCGMSSFILDYFDRFEPEVISNTIVRITSGIGAVQGRMFCIEPGLHDDVDIANGNQGLNRIDVICATVTTDDGTGTQSLEWEVVQGTKTSGSPVPPEIIIGDLDSGDNVARFPVVSVRLEGISISEVTVIADILPSLIDMNNTQPISRGGTGATTAAAARASLGITPGNIGALPSNGTAVAALSANTASSAATAASAAKLQTGRSLKVNLASGSGQTFDGSGDAQAIGVSGILSVGNGGSGSNSAQGALNNILGGSIIMLNSNHYGTSLPAAGNAGRLFFKKA